MKINSKLKPKREGPFEITKLIGKVSYRLHLPDQWRIHPIFHATLLRPYKETDQHGPNFPHPIPDVHPEKEAEYEVERIMNHRKRGRTYHYLIRWKEYTPDNNSWESEPNLANSPDIL